MYGFFIQLLIELILVIVIQELSQLFVNVQNFAGLRCNKDALGKVLDHSLVILF